MQYIVGLVRRTVETAALTDGIAVQTVVAAMQEEYDSAPIFTTPWMRSIGQLQQLQA